MKFWSQIAKYELPVVILLQLMIIFIFSFEKFIQSYWTKNLFILLSTLYKNIRRKLIAIEKLKRDPNYRNIYFCSCCNCSAVLDTNKINHSCSQTNILVYYAWKKSLSTQKREVFISFFIKIFIQIVNNDLFRTVLLNYS